MNVQSKLQPLLSYKHLPVKGVTMKLCALHQFTAVNVKNLVGMTDGHLMDIGACDSGSLAETFN